MKALIADDSLTVRLVLNKYLSEWGYDIVEAKDGKEAVSILSGQDPPRIALIDWMMPEMDGDVVLRTLQERDEESVFTYKIMLTSLSEQEDIVRGLDSGAHDYLTKPVEMGELRSRINVGRRLVNANDELVRLNHELEAEKKKSDDLLLNILPETIADELKATGKVKPVLFDSASVLFTDFEGFTKVACDMTPEQLVKELDMSFSAFDKIIGAYGLEKMKTIGDSYMCAAGIPTPRITHAIDIVSAACDIRDYFQKVIDDKVCRGEDCWGIRVGVNTGPIMAGVIGDKKFAYDVWGDTVNTASRLEHASELGRINISKATYELVKDYFECEYRGEIDVKGKGLIDMYFVHGKK